MQSPGDKILKNDVRHLCNMCLKNLPDTSKKCHNLHISSMADVRTEFWLNRASEAVYAYSYYWTLIRNHTPESQSTYGDPNSPTWDLCPTRFAVLLMLSPTVRLSRNITCAEDTAWPSQLVDNNDPWTSFNGTWLQWVRRISLYYDVLLFCVFINQSHEI